MEVIIDGGEAASWIDIQGRAMRFLPLPERGPARPTTKLRVPAEQWRSVFAPLVGTSWPVADTDVPVTPTHTGHVELVRRLIEPHARIAAGFELELRWPGADYPLVVRERRRWRSVLSPVYLQLLEALWRVTEGQRGAGFCRECGQPFLTLDARRSSFCNDRERFRFTQRERRKRKGRQRDALAQLEAGEARSEPEGAPVEDSQ